MKKILRFLPLVLLFLACEQGIIFHDIALEIELEEPNILGNVNSIVKCGDTLYTQNGNVYSKPLSTERGWEKINAPGRVISLAADDQNVYALAAEQEDDAGLEHSYQVYVLLGGTGDWKTVAGARLDTVIEEDETHGNNIVLFDNAVIGDAGRNAYIRKNSTVSLLSGEALGQAQSANGASESTVAAARISGVDYFSNSRAFCSNGVDTLYSIQDEAVSTSSDNTAWTASSVIITDTTVMVYAEGKLLVGTEEGLEQVSLDTSEKPLSKSNLDSNAEATLGEKEILSIGFFGGIDNNAIYAGGIEQYNTKNNGLWGYYPDRGNWNFE